jgi:hypothetical protein
MGTASAPRSGFFRRRVYNRKVCLHCTVTVNSISIELFYWMIVHSPQFTINGLLLKTSKSLVCMFSHHVAKRRLIYQTMVVKLDLDSKLQP